MLFTTPQLAFPPILLPQLPPPGRRLALGEETHCGNRPRTMAAIPAAPMDAPKSPAPILRRGWMPPKAPLLALTPGSPVSPLEMAEMAAAACGYEREREARIRENLARMQKLGILDLAQTLNQSAASRGRGRARKPVEPGSVAATGGKPKPPCPARRSLRLKSVEPASYSELPVKTEKGSKAVRSEFIEEGAKEEVYTEEHEKLLGTCHTPWTLFVDGYDKDGRRIYDQVTGKTCHQCRQKTLGHHTSCSSCQIVQGQLCGDCLYMRYGENVLEAKKNPNWICPVCRGICNCSICRTKRGWFPTGAAYRKVVSLGYKSVAHYLIATKRSSANSDDSSPADSSNKLLTVKLETSSISDHDAPVAKENLEDGETSSEATCRQVNKSDGNKDVSRSESVVSSDSRDDQVNTDAAGCATPSKPAVSRKRKVIEPSPDCVASRLRSRTHKP